MTVALKIAVPDGVVMGTDSRSTAVREDQKSQVFDGVQKVFLLHKDYPAAVMAWGLNRLGGESLQQLMTEVRHRLEGTSPDHLDWKLDTAKTKLPDVAQKITNHLFHEHYLPAVTEESGREPVILHFAGFSPGQTHTEHAEFKLTPEHIHGPDLSQRDHVQVNFSGPYVTRLLTGFDPRSLDNLVTAGIDKEVLAKATATFASDSLRDIVSPSMPLPEVAALVRSLINNEIVLNRLGPEPDIVGGDIQMVVIDRQGCREMRFKPIDFQIPATVWRYGHR